MFLVHHFFSFSLPVFFDTCEKWRLVINVHHGNPSFLALLKKEHEFSECVSLNAAIGGYLTNYMIADDLSLPNGG